MPRVATRTRKRVEVKRAMRCSGSPCVVARERLAGEDASGSWELENAAREIRVGDRYYTWARKNRGVFYQHVECGYPKRSQLSDRKTVVIEDAIDDANKAIGDWVPELAHAEPTYTDGYEDVRSALESVAEVARDVGQEYQDGFENMPEGFQQGGTGQAMEEVAQELDSWADELESWSPSSEDPDMPDREEDEDEDEYRERCQQALDDWAEEVRSDAEDAMSGMPEYQG